MTQKKENIQEHLWLWCHADLWMFLPSDGFCSEYGVTFEATIIDKFDVAFGSEGETLSLGCTVVIYPTVKKYQPEVVWYRDCKWKWKLFPAFSPSALFNGDRMPSAVPLKPSKWVHSHWSGERAILTLTHLNKEDEGMYTLRVNTKSGFETYSAYVFVRGKAGGFSKVFLLLLNSFTFCYATV